MAGNRTPEQEPPRNNNHPRPDMEPQLPAQGPLQPRMIKEEGQQPGEERMQPRRDSQKLSPQQQLSQQLQQHIPDTPQYRIIQKLQSRVPDTPQYKIIQKLQSGIRDTPGRDSPQQQQEDTASSKGDGPAGAPSPAPPPKQNSGGGQDLPQPLQSGMERLSGLSLADIRVHYDSEQPGFFGAHSFAQGRDIHLGPGRGDDLPHEAWHTVQQKQGRVPITRQFRDTGINDDPGLEREADVMGKKAVQRRKSGGNDTEPPQDATTSYKEGSYKVSDAMAVIRDKDNNWAPIKYKAGDGDLPMKLDENKKQVPDTSFVGKAKTIPKDTKIQIDDVYIQVSSTKTVNDKLKYVHVVGYGWTSASNISGGLKNHSVGVMKAVKPLSEVEGHYTVGVKNAIVLEPGHRYLTFENKKKLALNTVVTVKKTFKGYYRDNKSRNLAKVNVGTRPTFTSKGNYASKAHDKKKPDERKIIDKAAYERQEVPSYIPDTTKTPMKLGEHVMVGQASKRDTGTYVEVFTALARKESDGATIYTKGPALGWTNLLNLTKGFHTDLKGLNARWDQVVPDERYDRAKGKDTEGTAKFSGNDDMIKIVDSKSDIEHVAKEIWPSLKRMLDAANAAGKNLQVNTGFRDWDYQQAMVDGPYAANPAGFSSHQRGIAVDLNNKTDTGVGGINWWMERNAYRFGFVRTYKKYNEGHHWEYRPGEVVQPQEIEKEGKKYMKYTFATFSSKSTSIWDRNHVLEEIKAGPNTEEK